MGKSTNNTDKKIRRLEEELFDARRKKYMKERKIAPSKPKKTSKLKPILILGAIIGIPCLCVGLLVAHYFLIAKPAEEKRLADIVVEEEKEKARIEEAEAKQNRIDSQALTALYKANNRFSDCMGDEERNYSFWSDCLDEANHPTKKYSVDEALKLIKEVSFSKFDGSVDLRITLNLKDKQRKEAVRVSIVFPNSIGNEQIVAVIADANNQKIAKASGADHIGLEDLIEKIEKGWTEFDVLIATPDVMSKVAKLGKVIGQKGLMPNPKTGTVTQDVEKAVKSFKAGKITLKMQEGGIFQIKFGKVSMEEAKLKENFTTLIRAISDEIKKFGDQVYKDMKISPTMGPGINLDINSVKELL